MPVNLDCASQSLETTCDGIDDTVTDRDVYWFGEAPSLIKGAHGT
jgi:hypothetical protein